MQIQNFRKGSEAFESKFKPLERDSNHSNVNSNQSRDLKHSNQIRSIQMQVQTLQKTF